MKDEKEGKTTANMIHRKRKRREYSELDDKKEGYNDDDDDDASIYKMIIKVAIMIMTMIMIIKPEKGEKGINCNLEKLEKFSFSFT